MKRDGERWGKVRKFVYRAVDVGRSLLKFVVRKVWKSRFWYKN